jgi:ABC-type sugar transport system substrate-binding protein
MIVAQQVTASVVPAAAGLPFAPLLGIAIHMLLSVVLGLAFAATIWRLVAPRLGAAAFLATAAVSLALVWAFNFFVVLPVLNPGFVTLMPYGATLASKVLFGIAMGSVLLMSSPRRSAARHLHA